jgi:CRISPR-associated protein Csm4
MKTLRVKLKVKSGIVTPFQADTVFGHLCWIIYYQKGEAALSEFLKPFKDGNPPFVLSDGIPADLFDLLPKPLSVEFIIKDQNKTKEIKKIEWVSMNDFTSICLGTYFTAKLMRNPIKLVTSIHNAINRVTSTSFSEGGVYSLKEITIPEIFIYFKVIHDEWKDKLVDLFKLLSNFGFGRKKSIGKGHFSVDTVELYNGFTEIEDANGFVTLSNFCPAENDPIEGLYKTFVKYGKLGEEFTYCGNPFKKPLLMIKTGSVFKTNGKPKEFYGRMIENISDLMPEVVQYAYAFSVPIRYPDVLIKHYERETS